MNLFVRHRFQGFLVAALALVLSGLSAGSPLSAQTLRGSTGSLSRQNYQARQHDFTFIRNRGQLNNFVRKGWLVRVRPNADFELHGVSFPYARPAVKTFVERLADQYRSACGEKLVVTSLTRPRNYQPPNASPRSVHPTGMALDLRRSNSRTCRSWLERVLLALEARRVIEATRERWPPHYHLAVFPKQYLRYVEQVRNSPEAATYLVARGDTLWRIAKKHATTVAAVKATNRLRSNKIYPGQLLQLPTAR